MSEDEMRKEENLEHEVLDRLKTLEPIDFDYNVVDGSYVDAMLKARNIILDLYQKEKEKNKNLIKQLKEQNTEIQDISKQLREKEKEDIKMRAKFVLSLDEYILKDKIRDMKRYREFELQQEYKEFKNDIEWKTYNKILEEN